MRRGGTNPKAAEFPDFEHVKKVMAMPDWDSVPFDENAGNKSFRNCFEGNCPRKGFDYSIHNLVGTSLFKYYLRKLTCILYSFNDAKLPCEVSLS